MAYTQLFERVAEHVQRKGVKVRFVRGQPLEATAIERAGTQAFIPIPTSLLDFYAEIGNGLEFGWSAKGKGTIFANLEVSKIANCAPKSVDDVSWMPEWNDDYEFPYAADPALAKATALKMRRWLPFWNIGNGDSFCLDTSLNSSPVLFSQHDWYDGGSGENGHKVADSLFDFFCQWAQVCFQFPSNCQWSDVLSTNGSGINWTSDLFREPFRLPAGL